jgi:hypothetical protein
MPTLPRLAAIEFKKPALLSHKDPLSSFSSLSLVLVFRSPKSTTHSQRVVMGSDQDQQNAPELHNDDVTSEPSGPHGLLFLDATGSVPLGIGIGSIPVFRSAVAYYDKIFNVVGVQPAALVYTSATDRVFTNWEGGPQSTRKSGHILSSSSVFGCAHL